MYKKAHACNAMETLNFPCTVECASGAYALPMVWACTTLSLFLPLLPSLSCWTELHRNISCGPVTVPLDCRGPFFFRFFHSLSLSVYCLSVYPPPPPTSFLPPLSFCPELSLCPSPPPPPHPTPPLSLSLLSPISLPLFRSHLFPLTSSLTKRTFSLLLS